MAKKSKNKASGKKPVKKVGRTALRKTKGGALFDPFPKTSSGGGGGGGGVGKFI